MDDFHNISKNIETNETIENNFLKKEISESSQILIKIDEIIHKYKFNFEIILENGIYKLKGQSINENRPKSLVIDYSSKVGKCVADGKKLTISLNNISSIVDLEFDSSSLVTSIIKKYNFSEYFINYNFYKESIQNITKKMSGISVTQLICSPKPLIDSEKKDNEKIPSKSGTVKESFIL